ncbi:hypothetical protein FACS1894204_04060 [Synergistales bacterium]|nr:hypothetical protein FACS1894204_04060 [Synergistales bacterium]
MADETKVIIVNKGSTTEWANQVRPLEAGEFGYNTDTKETKMGDGESDFPSLRTFGEEFKLIVDELVTNRMAELIAGDGIEITPVEEGGEGLLKITISSSLGGIPSGLIGMWSGTLDEIPTGWALCNGENGSPNLTDKFVKGIATATTAPGNTGGANSLTLTAANMPAHTHTGPSHTHTSAAHTHTSAAHAHTFSGGTAASAGAHEHYLVALESSIYYGLRFLQFASSSGTSQYLMVDNTSTNGLGTNRAKAASSGAHTHTVTGTVASTTPGATGSTTPGATGASGTGATGSVGSGTAFDNRPAFYELAFIIKL